MADGCVKHGIILGMRSGLQSVALIGFLSLHACASARPPEVARLPACAFADTEVSPNFAFVVERPGCGLGEPGRRLGGCR